MSKEEKYYRKGIDTAQRIVALMEGKEGDYTGLEDELSASEYESLVEMLSDGEKIRLAVGGFNRPESRREASRFRGQALRRSVFRRVAAISSVAAAVALAVGTWYVTGWDDVEDNIVIAKVVNDVTLTLPDGSTIVLDPSAGNSRIAEHGNVALTMENGILVHEKQSSAAQAAKTSGLGTVEVPRGALFDLVLEDGTKVWLNASSRLRFPIEFSREERKVYLEGEAYFEVSPDKERPFFVEAKDQTLKVLGTKFNIYAYAGTPAVSTTLIEGSVSLRAKQGDVETILRPGQQAQLLAGGDGYSVMNVDAMEISAWRNGMFIFNDNTLEVVFSKLSRWYDFEYVFEDPHTAGIVVMGNIPVDFDFNTVLTLLNDLKVADIRSKGNVVTIKATK